jgi:predicted HD phosphohydrolase
LRSPEIQGRAAAGREDVRVQPLGSVSDVLALLAHGSEVRDEPTLDGLAHALQCAAILRVEHPDDPELAVAGLVHDIADIAYPDDHTDHDRKGAELVEPLFGPRVARLVGAHVVAKRYLVTTDPAYRKRLSARSVETLALQGEALDTADLDALATDPDLAAILDLRRADERAKDPDALVAPLESWRDLLTEVAGA